MYHLVFRSTKRPDSCVKALETKLGPERMQLLAKGQSTKLPDAVASRLGSTQVRGPESGADKHDDDRQADPDENNCFSILLTLLCPFSRPS